MELKPADFIIDAISHISWHLLDIKSWAEMYREWQIFQHIYWVLLVLYCLPCILWEYRYQCSFCSVYLKNHIIIYNYSQNRVQSGDISIATKEYISHEHFKNLVPEDWPCKHKCFLFILSDVWRQKFPFPTHYIAMLWNIGNWGILSSKHFAHQRNRAAWQRDKHFMGNL